MISVSSVNVHGEFTVVEKYYMSPMIYLTIAIKCMSLKAYSERIF